MKKENILMVDMMSKTSHMNRLIILFRVVIYLYGMFVF